jgi:hypothetical protein
MKGVENNDMCGDCAELLDKAMCWSLTEEGGNYWAEVYDRLMIKSGKEFSRRTSIDLGDMKKEVSRTIGI